MKRKMSYYEQIAQVRKEAARQIALADAARRSKKEEEESAEIDLYCKNHPYSHIVSFVLGHLPSEKAQQFYTEFEKLYGANWVEFETRSLFILKRKVMNTIKLRRIGE